MTAELLLRYQRVEMGEGNSTYDGELLERQTDGSSPAVPLHLFEQVAFKKLFVEVSHHLSAKEYERVILERTDRQGLAPMTLDAPTVELLRSDPAKAIRMMTYEGDNALSGGTRRAPPPAIAAGYDTISETVGDVIYCRVRFHKFTSGLTSPALECAGCGHWIPALRDLRCTKGCPLVIRATYVEGWGQLPTKVLLDLAFPHYFLPRGFNPTKPWISREDLQALYDQWLRVKEQHKESKT